MAINSFQGGNSFAGTNSFAGENTFGGTNSFTGTNTFQDPTKGTPSERQQVNLDALGDQGLAQLLIKDTNATARNSFSKHRYASSAATSKAANNYGAVDTSGWLNQYLNYVQPYVVGASSLSPGTAYVKRDSLDDIENKLTTTGTPEGYIKKAIDQYRFDLLNEKGESQGQMYYGVDDILRNQYDRQLGSVQSLTYSPPTDPENPTAIAPVYGGGSLVPIRRGLRGSRAEDTAALTTAMWSKFFQDHNVEDYLPKQQLKKEYANQAISPRSFQARYHPEWFETVAPKPAYQWGDNLYDEKTKADAARARQVAGRPGQYASLMEKYEAAGEGGLNPQDWRGGYGANNKFSGATAISQIGGDPWLKVDPRTGVWSSQGYKIGRNELAPAIHTNEGFAKKYEKGKASKLWKKAGDGKLTTETGGNIVWRDYGANAGALSQLLKQTAGGDYVMAESDLSKIPEFWNKNQHVYNQSVQSIKAKKSSSGLFNNVFNFVDPILDTVDPLHDPVQNIITNGLGFDSQQQAFSTIAPIVASILAMGADGGLLSAGAAAGAGAGAAAGALGTGLSWSQVAAGVNALDAASQGNWGGAAMGALGASGFSPGMGNFLPAGTSPLIGKLADSAIMGGIGGGVNSLSKGQNFFRGAGTGALTGLASGALGAAGSALLPGVSPVITGALSKVATPYLFGKKPSPQALRQAGVNALVSSLGSATRTR